ncbi:hypothetical protein HJG60_008151 [Phyllostomus discolor]|uniref:Uncharacterized protein n=1 Tax=Phyllostomus discolor TaxID=89673 RepID=A0A833ZAV0_9CHIR|nr:hypothetical protein HJG60_008151 [Phyllostomus discolor]
MFLIFVRVYLSQTDCVPGNATSDAPLSFLEGMFVEGFCLGKTSPWLYLYSSLLRTLGFPGQASCHMFSFTAMFSCSALSSVLSSSWMTGTGPVAGRIWSPGLGTDHLLSHFTSLSLSFLVSVMDKMVPVSPGKSNEKVCIS